MLDRFDDVEDTLAVIEHEFPSLSWLARRITEEGIVRDRALAAYVGHPYTGSTKPGYFVHLHGEAYMPDGRPFPSFKAEAETLEGALFGALTQAREARDASGPDLFG